MKKLLALLLIAFALSIFVPPAQAAETVKVVKINKKHRKHHKHRHHHHHHAIVVIRG